MMDNKGRNLIDFVGNIGGYTLNGTFGDREGKFTYVREIVQL